MGFAGIDILLLHGCQKMLASSAAASDRLDVERVRRDFPILHKPLPKGLPLVFLDSASSTQKPQAVMDRESEVYGNFYANAYRGVYRFGALVDEALEASRTAVQTLLNAESRDEIIFTAGTTMGLNIVAAGWGRSQLKPGDEILLSELEHHANLVPWQQVARQTGAHVRFFPLTDDLQLDLQQLDRVLTERTKVVAVTGMSNVTGTQPPIAELARRAHAVGAVIVVDGAQSVPHQATDVQAMGIDFLAFSGHKLFGPSGVGMLYGRRDLLDKMEPLLFGGHMISQVTCEGSTWAAPPAKFEAGTLPIAQGIALGAAVEYLRQIGFGAIQAHEHALLEYAHQRLAAIPGLKIYGPPIDKKGAIVSFTIDGAHAEDLAQLLNRRGVFVRHGHHCTMPLHAKLKVAATVRASFALYNTLAEVDALVDALQFARERLRLQ